VAPAQALTVSVAVTAVTPPGSWVTCGGESANEHAWSAKLGDAAEIDTVTGTAPANIVTARTDEKRARRQVIGRS
jgi:hypothetical protein